MCLCLAYAFHDVFMVEKRMNAVFSFRHRKSFLCWVEDCSHNNFEGELVTLGTFSSMDNTVSANAYSLFNLKLIEAGKHSILDYELN